MGKGTATREAIVGEALRQASRVGLEGLSLAPLADSLSLSKSGLFAHFRSKEALQLEIVGTAIDRFKRQVLLPGVAERDAEKRLRGIFDRYLTWIRGTDEDGGCPFMTMAQEYDDRPGPIRDRLVSSQRDWQSILHAIIQVGVTQRSFRDDADAQQAVFEITGAALSYQHSAKLMEHRNARRMAISAFEKIIDSLRPHDHLP